MELVALGKIVRPHGIHGSLFVHTDTGPSSALSYLDRVWISPTQSYDIEEAAWMPKGWKLDLQGIDTLSSSESLIGQILWAERSKLEPETQNEFYLHDLKNCEAIDEFTGIVVGHLTHIEDVDKQQQRWWFSCTKGEFSVPARKRHIKQVDTNKKRILIADYQSFLPE